MKISQKEIIEVIKKVTKKKIDINSSSKNISDWDSLAQLNILTVLDNKLKGKIFTIKQMATADSVKKIILLLKKNNFLSKD
jgi:acyl carrier protein